MNETFDVIVAGGGIAGCAAAIASARIGARTLLVERNHCLGGAATMRNVLTWCGIYTLGTKPIQVVRGIADEVLSAQNALGGLGSVTSFRGVFVPFEPESLKRVLDELALQAGVELRFGAQVISAKRTDDQLTNITIAHHGGRESIVGHAFVDCTGDGDLAAFGGAETRYGNPDGVNLGTLGCRFGGIPAEVYVSVDHIISAIKARKFPKNAITKDRSVIVRLPKSGDMVLYLPSYDFDPRVGASLTRAETNTRQQAWEYLEVVRTIPGCESAYLVSTGPETGTRESRHLECRHQLKWAEIEQRTQFDDTIAQGAWGAEWHDRKTYYSEFDYPPDKGSYNIPLSCLSSRNTKNLFCAGRLADGDQKGGAAIRVLGTSMATGQAAGTAAAFTANGNFSSSSIQALLRSAGSIVTAEDI